MKWFYMLMYRRHQNIAYHKYGALKYGTLHEIHIEKSRYWMAKYHGK